MSLPFYTYIVLNGHKYPVLADTYSMKWTRAFSSQIAGNIIRLNFIDKGPGIRVYDMILLIKTWATTDPLYKVGITLPWTTQLQNLEASYGLQATVLHFEDPFGRSPTPASGGPGDYGVFFINLVEIIPNYSTPQSPVALVQIELTEATQLVNA